MEIAAVLERQASAIVALLEEERVAEKERKRLREIEHREWERKEAERRKIENEKARIAEFEEQLERWRFARDARALVAHAQHLITSDGLRVSKGGPVEKWFQ